MGKKNDIKIDPETLYDALTALEDPRIDRTKKHAFIDILIISVCAAICGAKTWIDIEDFGHSKIEWFKTFLDLKHGIPSHDTFRRIFIILKPEKFLDVFIAWVKLVTKETDLEQICIDGKTLRKSFDKAKSNSAIHMINAWSTGASLSLGMMKSEGKANEINTVPKLLDKVEVENCIVSTDAMNCQKKIAEKIIEKKGDYLFAVKGNQEKLEIELKKQFEILKKSGSKSVKIDEFSFESNGHGRVETRTCKVLYPKNNNLFDSSEFKKWPSLNSLIEITSTRSNVKNKTTESEKRYYISSCKDSAKVLLKAVKNHWEVENKLHWVLDVVFREDDCRSRAGHSPENFSILRQLALNLIKSEPSKKSIRRKVNLAGWDEKFLLKILLGEQN